MPPSSPAQDQLDRLAAAHDARLSVWMGSLDGTAWLARDAETEHPAASTLKLALVIALHRCAADRSLSLDDEVLVRSHSDSAVPGQAYDTTQDYDQDDAVWDRLGDSVPLRWLGERAITRSSNLATNLLIDRLGTAAVNAVYARAGAKHAKVERGIQDTPAMAAGLSNTVTAADLAAVFVSLLAGRLIPDAGDVERVLAANEWNEAIPAGLPKGTYVAHKTGWFDGVCHDAALVRPHGEEPFVLVLLSGAGLDETGMHALVADAARICWQHRQNRQRGRYDHKNVDPFVREVDR